MDFRYIDRPNRRELIRGAVMLGAGAAMMSPLPILAASSQTSAIRKAAEAGKDASIKRIRDWIALPSIAAENRSMAEGAAYMAELAKDAGFTNVEIVPTTTMIEGSRPTIGRKAKKGILNKGASTGWRKATVKFISSLEWWHRWSAHRKRTRWFARCHT